MVVVVEVSLPQNPQIMMDLLLPQNLKESLRNLVILLLLQLPLHRHQLQNQVTHTLLFKTTKLPDKMCVVRLFILISLSTCQLAQMFQKDLGDVCEREREHKPAN
jgi:hypothetical protein